MEHCIGPLGVGTLIVKPTRHVTAVEELSEEEAIELGPLLPLASDVAAQLVGAEQVYNSLWSHAGGQPCHIHFVVQPVTSQQIKEHGSYGPALQMAMFASGAMPPVADVEDAANRARELIRGQRS